jgi:DNA-3-methyladenine glycosylase I
MNRCHWANKSKLYQDYHDKEWGRPLHDDRLLFELLMLEGAQAGLSWETVLKKRDGYRNAFDQFNIEKITHYSQKKIESLLQNPSIIRNKLKIKSTIINANCCLEIQKEYGTFDRYIWQFVNGEPIVNSWRNMADIPANTPESDTMSHALKKRGFSFIGTTICYAFMQATGMVNDHLIDCDCYSEVN